jgi:CRISPR-associated protein Cas5h
MSQIEKVLVFDIWGDYAHFRRIETTTSPLTYSIPTITALSGIISAVIGLERDSYYEFFSPENAKFAVRILQPIKKVRINISLIDTSRGFYLWDIRENPRTLIPFEFVKNPKYRIYVWLKNEGLHEKLKEFLKNHKTFYTPYLGISELIANFNFIGEFKDIALKKASAGEKIHSVIRRDRMEIMVEDGTYILERIPLAMNRDRVVQEYVDILYEINGKELKIKKGEFYKVGEENVIFL